MSKALGDQLREAIDRSGMSRYAICKAVGLDQASMSKFMAGHRSLSLETVERICKLLNLHLTEKAKR
jgi:transcriptional regulator with XRE-family HTH domain